MTMTEFPLVKPVDLPVKNLQPGTPAVERVEVLRLRPIGGRATLDLGAPTLFGQSIGGGVYWVEVDAVIEAYEKRIVDHPRAAEILEALGLADAKALRDHVLDQHAAAEARANAAREGADPELVILLDPPEIHGQPVTQVRLTEPTGALYGKLGDPITWSRMPGGAMHPLERLDVVRRYVEASVRHELGADLFGFLSLSDALAIKKAVLSFFSEAAMANLTRRSMASSSPGGSSASATPVA